MKLLPRKQVTIIHLTNGKDGESLSGDNSQLEVRVEMCPEDCGKPPLFDSVCYDIQVSVEHHLFIIRFAAAGAGVPLMECSSYSRDWITKEVVFYRSRRDRFSPLKCIKVERALLDDIMMIICARENHHIFAYGILE